MARLSATRSTTTNTNGVVRGLVVGCLVLAPFAGAFGQELPPQLTQPVNDFAGVVDPQSAGRMDSMIRSLQQASGDVVVVATVDTVQPYGDIREYATKMFENHGRGIGDKGKDNGLLILLAVKDRQVWVEVGYDLEEFITDGFAGELSRKVMAPEFRRGAYGAGLLAGVTRIAGRIAERRGVTLHGVPPRPSGPSEDEVGFGATTIVVLIILIVLLNLVGRTRRRRRFWGGPPWSGWNSGVGPFGGGSFGRGGGFGGGFGGFGGGGFGGFGGGRSGGGGGGASW